MNDASVLILEFFHGTFVIEFILRPIFFGGQARKKVWDRQEFYVVKYVSPEVF